MQHALSDGEVTLLLQEWQAGDLEALGLVIGHVYTDLRRLAASYFQSERPDHTLQPTALVHEVYAQLLHIKPQFNGRKHFLRCACLMMRRLLLNHARARKTQKRDRVSVSHPSLDASFPDPDTLLAINEVLTQLRTSDPRLVRIVELRFFLGLTLEEIGALLCISKRTVKREWAAAKTWLAHCLKSRRSPNEPLAKA